MQLFPLTLSAISYLFLFAHELTPICHPVGLIRFHSPLIPLTCCLFAAPDKELIFFFKFPILLPKSFLQRALC